MVSDGSSKGFAGRVADILGFGRRHRRRCNEAGLAGDARGACCRLGWTSLGGIGPHHPRAGRRVQGRGWTDRPEGIGRSWAKTDSEATSRVPRSRLQVGQRRRHLRFRRVGHGLDTYLVRIRVHLVGGLSKYLPLAILGAAAHGGADHSIKKRPRSGQEAAGRLLGIMVVMGVRDG